MRIAYICTFAPWLQLAGGMVRTFHAIQALSLRHRLELFVSSPHFSGRSGTELVPTHIFRSPSALERMWRTIYRPLPPSIAKYASRDLARSLAARLSAFDCMIVDHLANSYVYPLCKQIRTVYLAHNVESLLMQSRTDPSRQIVRNAGFNLLSRQLLSYEKSFISRCRVAAFVSQVDRSILGDSAQQSIVFENGVDTLEKKFLPELPTEPRLLFVGSLNYFPNAQALHLLYTDLLPRLKRTVPRIHLDVVGFSSSQAGPAIPRDLRECVRIHTNVAALAPYYQAARAVVVPLRTGSGSRLKILEAMAFGRPVISSIKGIEGLNVNEDEHCLLGDSDGSFCDRILRVLRDDQLANDIRLRARRHVERNYDWRIVSRPLVDALESL